MRAIAFAILCAAYISLPSAEVMQWHASFRAINALVFFVCIVGFWLNIFSKE